MICALFVALTNTFISAHAQVASFHASAPALLADEPKSEAPPKVEKVVVEEPVPIGGLASRFAVTAEVTVSKIFPAGFGWQGVSNVSLEFPHNHISLEAILTRHLHVLLLKSRGPSHSSTLNSRQSGASSILLDRQILCMFI